MNILATNKSFFSGSDRDRPEVEEFRRSILNRLLYVFSLLGQPAACIGVTQSYVQGRWVFSLLYAGIYIIFLVGTFAARRLPYRIRALILISSLFLIAFAILMRIGMSGVGMQLMLGACFMSALFYGIRTGILVLLISLACVTYVAFGMTTGFIEIYPEQMLTSKSSLAWLTGLFVFFIMVSITVSAPEMLRRRIEESLDLLQEKKNDVETTNRQLQQEIQAHRQTEEELREERQRLAAIIEGTNIGTWEWNVQTGETVFNERWADIIGYTLEEISPVSIGTWERFAHPDDLKASGDLLDRHFAGELDYYEFESRMKHKDGRWVWVLDRGKVSSWMEDGKPLLMQGTHQDITDRKRAEEALRQSEERMRLFFERQLVGMAITSPEKGWLQVNKKLIEMLGYSPVELSLKTWAELTHPDDLAADVAQFNRLLSGEINQYFLEKRFIRKDGAVINVNLSVGCVRRQDSSVDYVLALLEDITERKRADIKLRTAYEQLRVADEQTRAQYDSLVKSEQALQESEERFRRLAESARDCIWVTDMNLRYTYVSPYIKEGLGYTPEEYMTIPLHETLTQASLDTCMQLFAEELEIEKRGNKDLLRSRTVELEQIHKNGHIVNVEIKMTFLRDDAGQAIGILGYTRDITERKRAEEEKEKLKEQLDRAQKLESIGTLAGGIAHDFNNLLTGIQGHASLMMLDLDTSNPHHVRLKHIEELVQSGADLTRQLLGFAQGGRYAVKPADMNEIVEKTSAMFGRTKKEITIHRKYVKDLWIVEADRSQMEQVFMNLFVNAWHAMPGGGEIYLETDNVAVPDGGTLSITPGRYVKITISDTGTGMDALTLKRIFDPFFTTRKMGRGTGLGLATVYGIIKGHGGMIDVTSEPGHGTTFYIHLPATEKALVREEAATKDAPRGNETILLVDDEKMVLDVARAMLEFLGYRVHCVGSGQEAVAVYHEMKNKISLVVLDMIMPGISGSETFDRLRGIDPGIKVLLSSGYSINGEAQAIMSKGCNGFLQKPFQLEQLAQKVRAVLAVEKEGP
jgi:PAS domain S-box-containing protein